MTLLKVTFAALMTLTVSYLALSDANAYDPCERCYKQYDACIAAGTARSKCQAALLTCTRKYCTL